MTLLSPARHIFAHHPSASSKRKNMQMTEKRVINFLVAFIFINSPSLNNFESFALGYGFIIGGKLGRIMNQLRK